MNRSLKIKTKSSASVLGRAPLGIWLREIKKKRMYLIDKKQKAKSER
jgi:hypothetical protein